MTAQSETEIEHAVPAGVHSTVSSSRRARHRREAIALVWPSTSTECARLFEDWAAAAMRCLRATDSDFAILVSLKKLLRTDGKIIATNMELAIGAGCHSKALEFDLGQLKASGLIVSTVRSMAGFRGRTRVLRLAMPAPDGTDGRT
jgi:hypothetical protein